MAETYFKRFRMEIDPHRTPAVPDLPQGYFWVPWSPGLAFSHGQVKFRCFRHEIDARLFPCFRELIGCVDLMANLANRPGFCPEATWLVGNDRGYVGTIQGLLTFSQVGMIQNVGIIPEARGLGLGTTLLLKCLDGFRRLGVRCCALEVTADNTGALRLYRRLGFHRARVLYRAALPC